MKNFPRLLAMSLIAGLLSACMGSFVLTRKLYAWNETVTGSKVVNNVIFWALNIVPIYSFAVGGDAFILNLIEFWTGTNLLADDAAAGGAGGDRVAVVANDDGTVTVTKGAERFVLVPHSADRVDVVVNGARVGSAERTANGGVVAFDAQGQEIGVVTPEEAELGADLAAKALSRD